MKTFLLGMTGLLGLGLLAVPTTVFATGDDPTAFVKREDQDSSLVLVADDDLDDPDGTGDGVTRTRTRTGASRNTHDGTRSNFTAVSRDRDLSRGDKTRDWTRDGGDRTRDHSANRTNDRSRNDSRR
jgi:hypothetical protein